MNTWCGISAAWFCHASSPSPGWMKSSLASHFKWASPFSFWLPQMVVIFLLSQNYNFKVFVKSNWEVSWPSENRKDWNCLPAQILLKFSWLYHGLGDFANSLQIVIALVGASVLGVVLSAVAGQQPNQGTQVCEANSRWPGGAGAGSPTARAQTGCRFRIRWNSAADDSSGVHLELPVGGYERQRVERDSDPPNTQDVDVFDDAVVRDHRVGEIGQCHCDAVETKHSQGRLCNV